MIQANCRARFTAPDFDFIVRTLANSSRDAVSLAELLSDLDTRDIVLDHEKLVHAVLNEAGALTISSHLYFYILARYVLKRAGFADRKLSDYIAALLEEFSRTQRLQNPVDHENVGRVYLSDLLIALQKATPQECFLIQAHVGNYTLFVSGIFHENVSRRSRKWGPDFSFYEEMGRVNFKAASSHQAARRADLVDVYGLLAEAFHEVRLALNQLSDELLNLDEETPTLLG